MDGRTRFANINNSNIYFEIAGDGIPFVMIHAGVADSRQWNNEFDLFLTKYKVLRYDLRGYGKSKPVEGDFNHLNDLTALLDHLGLAEPVVLMGCSMGGSLAMDFAQTLPSRVRGLIMVSSAPSGLKLDTPALPKFDEAERAYEAGDLDLAAEIETQIWFDGSGRTPEQTNQKMRKLAYEMNRNVLELQSRALGWRLPNTPSPLYEDLQKLAIPVLIVVGSHDTPYILGASRYMQENLKHSQLATIQDAAHLPNMDRPEQFQEIVKNYLKGI